MLIKMQSQWKAKSLMEPQLEALIDMWRHCKPRLVCLRILIISSSVLMDVCELKHEAVPARSVHLDALH